jgi:Zn-dependent protease
MQGKAHDNMKCQKCGQETFLPFQCPYCGDRFCAAHRLPENHACPKIELARSSRQEEVVVLQAPKSYDFSVTFGQPRMTKGKVYFSPKEVKHLAVAAVLVMGIGLSLLLYPEIFGTADSASLTAVSVYAIVLTLSFFAHEIAHKVTAQRRGLWAEFRLTMWGAALTLVSVLSPVFKIISPGAMMVSGSASIRDMGKVSLAGPAVNIFLSAVLFGGALSSVTVAPDLSVVLLLAAFLNGFMAVFNLIPFGVFDGFKIFSWNKKIWAIMFAMSAALAIVIYLVYYGYV